MYWQPLDPLSGPKCLREYFGLRVHSRQQWIPCHNELGDNERVNDYINQAVAMFEDHSTLIPPSRSQCVGTLNSEEMKAYSESQNVLDG